MRQTLLGSRASIKSPASTTKVASKLSSSEFCHCLLLLSGPEAGSQIFGTSLIPASPRTASCDELSDWRAPTDTAVQVSLPAYLNARAPRASLLGLPTELRIRIYRHHLQYATDCYWEYFAIGPTTYNDFGYESLNYVGPSDVQAPHGHQQSVFYNPPRDACAP